MAIKIQGTNVIDDNQGLRITGVSTFTNGPVFIGAATSTGTASQTLQVTGGAYVSGSVGIGTTNPSSLLTVQGNALITGIGTITTLSGTTASFGTLNVTTGNIVTGVITNAQGTNLNYTGVGTITNLRGTNVNYTGVGTIATLNSTVSTITNLGGTNVNYTGVGTITNLRGTNINISGIVTATGGFNIGIQSGGLNVVTGVITALNFIGAGNTFSYNSTTKIVDISISGSGGSSGVSISTNTTNQAQFLTYAVSTGTTTGLGVTTSSLVFNPSTTRLGIGNTNPAFTADVTGDLRIRSTNTLRFGGTTGTTNFYIQYNSTNNSLDFVAG